MSDVTDTPEAELRKRLAAVRLAAMNLLARREHSRRELAAKLAAKFPELAGEPGDLQGVLDRLVAEGLLSDARFAGALLRSRAGRGQGPCRIRQELAQRGVAEELIEQAFAEAAYDWFELARQTAQKRFGAGPPQDYRERGKRSRFLQYRGFSADQIQNAID